MSVAGGSGRLLDGRVVAVTGGARGIGLSIATRMASHGARVAILDLDHDQTRDAATRVSDETGAQVLGRACDVTDPARLAEVADDIESHLGRVDVVVPNAGILVLKPALEMTPAEFDAVLRVNLYGAFTTAVEFARRMPRDGTDGRIIFTSSLFGLRGGVGNAAYAASKFGILGLAQSMAAELAPSGIRVNSVCPGQIESAMIRQLFQDRAAAHGTEPAQERAAFVGHIPLGELGDPGDVADTYVYLASSLSTYVTGQHVVVDGGWSVGPT
jgi:NAD(P)-dependent dehydrogenase (short-subunit alcohol dehydrogenase family)